MKNNFIQARIFMGSVTNIANRPFRRFVTELGAEATIGEMAIAHYIAKGGKQDRALLKRDPREQRFGAQIVGANPKQLAKAAQLAETMGADFIDFNCACPHASVISHGSGALLLKRPQHLATPIMAIREATTRPVTLKIRKGFDADDNVVAEIVDVAQQCGLSAIFIHARTRAQLYRGDNDWNCIEAAAQSADIPIIGCGDLAHGSQVLEKLAHTHCAGLAIARGALIKPWIFQEIQLGRALDPCAEQRLEWLRTLVAYTLEDFGTDARGLTKSLTFLRNQMGFLTRYVPTGAIGHEVAMQERAGTWTPRDALEAMWAAQDRQTHDALLKLAGFPDTPSDNSANKDTSDSQTAPNA